MTDTNRIWQQVCAVLKPGMTQASYATWLEPLTLVSVGDGAAVLQADSQYSADWALRKFKTELRQAFRAVVGSDVAVAVRAAERALNNLNLNNNQVNLNGRDSSKQATSQSVTGSSSQKNFNLNNLKAEQKRGGVPRLTLYTDEVFKKALSWGVEEWLLQVSIREYGEYTVKGQINRIHCIPNGYFKPQYGDVNTQRGRIFNKEMQKLKANRAS